MTPLRMKKWPRVAVPVLFLCFILSRCLYMLCINAKPKPPVEKTWFTETLDYARKLYPAPTRNVFDSDQSESKTIKVIVVEEHHEVIPYWFEAANKGILPKTKNVLIHIDGHTDVALPSYNPDIPFFSWPHNRKQVMNMVQTNDDFVMSAVIAGLISHLNLITPSWDESNNVTMHVTNVDIGTVEPADPKRPLLCACLVFPGFDVYTCKGQTIYETRNVGFIDKSKCKIRHQIDAKQSVDFMALNLLKRRDWVGPSPNIILDIDEDFFGVELAAQFMTDAGLEWDKVDQLDTPLMYIFCPTHIKHEAIGNNLIREIISSVLRNCNKSFREIDSFCRAKITSPSDHLRRFFLSTWVASPKMFCQRSVDAMLDKLNDLTTILSRFRLVDLHMMRDFGFCLSDTPASARFRRAGHGRLVLCTGSNTPRHNIVFLHKPDADEIEKRAERLRKILTLIDLYHRPSVVTVCRSVRDGYTPRSLFSTIEASILDIFKDLRGHYEVLYDENLYGGKGGWPDRHRINAGMH